MTQAAARLSTRLKTLYSTGDLATSIPITIIMYFRFVFLADIAGLGPALAGWVVLIGRLWDAVNDPLIGQWSDRIRSRFGRRRVLLLFGSLPLGLSFVMMWLVPFGENQVMALAVYYTLTFIAFDTMYTVIHLGYNSLTPELTTDYDERSSLNGYRMAYSIGGALGAIILKTVLGWYITDLETLYQVTGIGLGVFIVLPPLVVFIVTKDHKAPAEHDEALPTLDALRHTLTNKPFWMVMGLYLFSWTTASIMASMLVFYIQYYMQSPGQADYVVLVAQSAAILFIPVCVRLSQKLDKRRSFIVGAGAWIAVLLGISGLQPDQLGIAYILAGLAGFGIATAYVVPWSMVPDIIEEDQIKTGRRREGSFYAFIAFFQKLGTAVALWAVGQMLAYSGYVTPLRETINDGIARFGGSAATAPGIDEAARANIAALVDTMTGLPAQSAATLDTMRLFMGPVPAALLLLAILCIWNYPISRQRHQDNLEQLSEDVEATVPIP